MLRHEVWLTLRVSESIVLAYFAFLSCACLIAPLRFKRRVFVAIASAASAAAVLLIARHGNATLRNWAPVGDLFVGYYLPGQFFERPTIRVEAWLIGWDRRILGDPVTRFASWPRALVAYLDIVYMGTFVLIPAGFAVLVWTGRTALADHYWTLVAGADLAAFLSLTIFQTRPPWALERPAGPETRAVHRTALAFVRHGTIGANTFPSGHTAVTFAIAYALLPTNPAVGTIFLALAATIAVACVVGRYHYFVDVIAGLVLSVAVLLVVVMAGV